MSRKGTSKRRWTDEEFGILLDHKSLSARELGEKLSRSAQSVQHMRSALRDGYTPEKEALTEYEIAFVKATPHLTAQQVARDSGTTRRRVEYVRHHLALQGFRFGSHGGQKNPQHVGSRRLLAKTCLGCGALLDASWFSFKRKHKSWQSKCNRCLGALFPNSRSTFSKDGGKSARATSERLQALTRERATRHGLPWLDIDHEILRDKDLTAFEKALALGRTYAATHHAVSSNGYSSRVGRGDPSKGQWIIDNPNEQQTAA